MDTQRMHFIFKFKIVLPVLISIFALFLFSKSVEASLVTVKTDGEVIVNVLAADNLIALSIPKRESLSVNGANIDLFREGDSIKLALNDTKMDVTQYKDNLIEIEETPQKQRVKISLTDGKFKIEQGDIFVLTSFPIEINPEGKQISVKTETGDKYLTILPKEAADILLRSKSIDNLTSANNVLEEVNGILVYKLNGNKSVNVFNIADYSTEVETQVSASSGEIISSNEPVWMKLVSFFLP